MEHDEQPSADDPNSAYRRVFSITQMPAYGSMVGESRRTRRWLLVFIVVVVAAVVVLAVLAPG